MHACACCCRKCLFKWHRIPEGTEWNESRQGNFKEKQNPCRLIH
ncbi:MULTISPECIES: DUF4186 family protein [Eubacteriales]